MTIRTNHMTNPAMKTVSATPQVMRTNLISNSSMETSGAPVAVRTNLTTNPGGETSSGVTNVRTNLVSSSRGVSGLTQYAGTGTQTTGVPISGLPGGITTALRVSYTAQSNPGVSLLNVPETGVTYAMSAWIYHESIMSTPGSQGFAQSGVISSPAPPPIEVGKWIKMSWVHTANGTTNLGFRVSSNSGTGTGSFLITGMIVEVAGIAQPFFDGATTTLNMCSNPSFEVNTFDWVSRWYGSTGGAGNTMRSVGTGMGGGASIRKTWTTANTDAAVDTGINYLDVVVAAGMTFTASIYQRSSVATYLTCFIVWKDAAGAELGRTPTTNNVASPAGAYVRGSVTGTAPAGAVKADFIFGPYALAAPMPAGSYIDWDWCLIEEGDTLNPYYDGTAAAPADFTYLWTGASNNSSSVQRAPQPAVYARNNTTSKVWQSSVISNKGSKSIACESTSGSGSYNGVLFSSPTLPIGTYTVSGYVYLPGAYGTSGVAVMAQGSGAPLARGNSVTATGSWLRTSLTFTTTAVGGVSIYFITAIGVPAPVGAKFWLDSVMLEATPDLSPYFDAANPRTNLLANPSFETNITGWINAGNPVSSVTQDYAPVYSGTKSLRVTCDGAVANQGAFTNIRTPVKPSRYYTASVWVKADIGKTMRVELGEWDAGTNIVGGGRTSGVPVVGTGEWMRLSVSRLMGPTADSVDVIVRNANAVAHTFWVDAAMLEEGAELNDYIEGTGPFTYAWTGTANASASEQRATSVSGITWIGAMAPYQSSEKSFTGTKSLYVEGNPSDTVYQVFTGPTVSGLTVGLSYTLSAWVYIVPGSVGLELQPSGVGSIISGKTTTSGRWERIYQTFSAASTSHMLRLRTIADGKVSAYIDGMLLEQGVQLLPYFDGATPAYENIAYPTSSGMTGATVTNGVAYMGTIWSRVTAVTGSGGVMARNIVSLNKLTPFQPYTASVTVANDGATSVSVALDWCDTNQVSIVLAPGETRRISTTGIGLPSRSYDAVYRFADLQILQSLTEQKSILFKDWLIERGSTLNNYYSGMGDFHYAWTGTVDNSTSTQRFYPVIGQAASKSNSDANSRFFGYSSVDETGNKVAKYLAPAGTPSSTWRVASINNLDYANIQAGKTYTLYVKYRTSGWPSAALVAGVQLSGGDGLNGVMSPDPAYQLSLQGDGWKIYRRHFVANINALANTIVYFSLPNTPDPVTDGILEVAEIMLVDNSHSGDYFDGETVSTDPDFSYVWSGTANASTSKTLATVVNGVSNTTTHGHALSSTEWKSSGSRSIRLIAKNNGNNDSFTDLRPMVAANLKPNTKYTIAGTRYLKAPLTGTLFSAPGYRVNIGGDRSITYKPGYGLVNVAGASRVVATFTTNDSTLLSFIRIHNGSMEGNGDVWWDDLMLVEGDYDGRYLDGTKVNAQWDGPANASTSVGYPTTLESLIGMPLFYATTAGTFALDSSKLSPTAPRTMYSVVDAPLDLPGSGIDVIWTYGQDSLTDSPANSTITFRYQSEAGTTSNSILSRRTGGAGALKGGVPVPGRYVMFCGLSEDGFLFTGHGGSQTPVYDNLAMNIPHERMTVTVDGTYHKHVATYIYAGLHTPEVRAEVVKLLAQRHNVPALV